MSSSCTEGDFNYIPAQLSMAARNCYVPGEITIGGGTFSLEGPEGKAFYTRSRVFSESELKELGHESASN